MIDEATPDRAPRFAQLRMEELDEAGRRVADEVVKFAGGIGGPFNVMLRSAELADLCFRLGSYVLFGTKLPRRLVELAVLIGARVSGSQLEFWAHRRRALAEGLPDSVIDALAAGRRPEGLDEDEAALFDYCVALAKKGPLDDAVFARARDRFGERGAVDLAAVVGFYGLVTMFLKAGNVYPPAEVPLPLVPMRDPFPAG